MRARSGCPSGSLNAVPRVYSPFPRWRTLLTMPRVLAAARAGCCHAAGCLFTPAFYEPPPRGSTLSLRTTASLCSSGVLLPDAGALLWFASRRFRLFARLRGYYSQHSRLRRTTCTAVCAAPATYCYYPATAFASACGISPCQRAAVVARRARPRARCTTRLRASAAPARTWFTINAFGSRFLPRHGARYDNFLALLPIAPPNTTARLIPGSLPVLFSILTTGRLVKQRQPPQRYASATTAARRGDISLAAAERLRMVQPPHCAPRWHGARNKLPSTACRATRAYVPRISLYQRPAGGEHRRSALPGLPVVSSRAWHYARMPALARTDTWLPLRTPRFL